MQQACTDDQHKIIICQNTADGAAHKIASYYYKSVMLKGKKFPIPLFIPNQFDNAKLKELNPLNYFPDLKTHRNNFPVFQKSPYEEGQFTEA